MEKALGVETGGTLVIVYGMFSRGKCVLSKKVQPKPLCPEGLELFRKRKHWLVGVVGQRVLNASLTRGWGES